MTEQRLINAVRAVVDERRRPGIERKRRVMRVALAELESALDAYDADAAASYDCSTVYEELDKEFFRYANEIGVLQENTSGFEQDDFDRIEQTMSASSGEIAARVPGMIERFEKMEKP